jgi:hypothetical protein
MLSAENNTLYQSLLCEYAPANNNRYGIKLSLNEMNEILHPLIDMSAENGDNELHALFRLCKADALLYTPWYYINRSQTGIKVSYGWDLGYMRNNRVIDGSVTDQPPKKYFVQLKGFKQYRAGIDIIDVSYKEGTVIRKFYPTAVDAMVDLGRVVQKLDAI